MASRHRLAAAVLTLAAAVLWPATPAQAAPLGTIALNPTSGTVDANSMLVSGTTSAKCPAEYGQNAVLRVGPIGGPYNNLNRIGSDGNYDQAPFTLATNRSMTAALGTQPANGDYEIVIECSGVILGTHPDKFVTAITVTGGNWAARTGPSPGPVPSASASGSGSVSLNASIAPSPSSGSPSVSPAPPGGGDDLPTTGFPIALIVLIGLLLLGGGAAAVHVARRRRAA